MGLVLNDFRHYVLVDGVTASAVAVDEGGVADEVDQSGKTATCVMNDRVRSGLEGRWITARDS